MATTAVPIKDRDVEVEKLDEVQVMLLMREMRIGADDGSDYRRKLTAIATCYDIIESVIVKDEDRQYLTDLVKRRELSLKDLMGVVTSIHDTQADPVPAVRRGRTSRAKA